MGLYLLQNLVTREQAGSMSDQAIVNLIFHPGFSTAESVTDVFEQSDFLTFHVPLNDATLEDLVATARSLGADVSTLG